MRVRVCAEQIPSRVAAGAYIVHAGWDKFHSDSRRSTAVHGMAVKAYPFLSRIEPATFVRALSLSEMALGTALLVPLVPDRAAGIGLTSFAGALYVMYLRSGDLHKPRSIWPTAAGTAVSKDMWMLGMGVGMALGRSGKNVG